MLFLPDGSPGPVQPHTALNARSRAGIPGITELNRREGQGRGWGIPGLGQDIPEQGQGIPKNGQDILGYGQDILNMVQESQIVARTP